MIEISQVEISKQRLAAMPANERAFFLFLGHAMNEMSCLSKLIIMTSNIKPQDRLVDHVHTGQSLILLRVLIGKCHEAWDEFLEAGQLRRKYIPMLPENFKSAQRDLKKLIDTGGILERVRNIAFHCPSPAEANAAFANVPEDESWLFYLGKATGNSFYYASELVMQQAMIDKISSHSSPQEDGKDELISKFKVICDITIKTSDKLSALFREYMFAIIKEHWDAELPMIPIARLEAPILEEFAIPFFVERRSNKS